MGDDTQTVTMNTDGTDGTTSTASDQQPGQSAGTENTDTTQADDRTVPYERFQQINQQMRAMEAKLSERDDAEKAAADAKLKEQGKLQELLDAKSAELDAAQQQIDALDAAQRTTSVIRAIESAATEIGFANPADATAFLELDAVELDDDGAPIGIVERIKTMADERPYLLAKTTPTPGNGAGPTPTGRTDKTDEQIKRDSARYVRSRF